jgi:hypothetical protein
VKSCFKCHVEKPLTEFYRHAQMGDGHLNKCKDCTKTDTKRNYRVTVPERQAYERVRNQEPARKAARLQYQTNRRAKHPEKHQAHNAVRNAIKSGLLVRRPCEVCQSPASEAHHPDYSRPLHVEWLCRRHHREREGRVALPLEAT